MDNNKKLQGCVMGANIIAYEKNNRSYGMTGSWTTMVDNQRIAMLIGPQSITGQNLEIGDIVGISGLNENQLAIATHFGTTHSDQSDKFLNINLIKENTAYLVPDATTQMVAEVEQITSIKDNGHARFIIFKILNFISNDIPFLICNHK